MQANNKVELSDDELDRLDFVHNTIHDMLCTLADRQLPWDIEPVGEISDIAEEYICDKLKIMTKEEFAPYCTGGL